MRIGDTKKIKLILAVTSVLDYKVAFFCGRGGGLLHKIIGTRALTQVLHYQYCRKTYACTKRKYMVLRINTCKGMPGISGPEALVADVRIHMYIKQP